MKVSVNWIGYYNRLCKSSADPMPNGIEDLVEKIGAQLGSIDGVIDLGKRYSGVLVVQVVVCQKHPDADKLSLCLVNDGAVTKNVKRNGDGLIQVVCGAPNVKAGMLAAWIPPGVTVPSTWDKDPFVLEVREIRGKVSNGMLVSPKELGIGDSREGILDLDELESDSGFRIPDSGKSSIVGRTLKEVLELDDYIIDIENKMFTHRPDLFGQLGIAREIAGIYGHAYKSPDWYKVDAPVPSSNAQNNLKVEVKNEVPQLVPRFCLLPIKDVKVGPSPLWLQARLSSIGVKSINNIVDLTNYIAHLTAQPTHAYDFDKLKAKSLKPKAKSSGQRVQIVVRRSNKGEKLVLLGGKEITLHEGAIVIATNKQAIGLGGVMGGADTEVDETTKNIVLECATFDMNTIRRMSMTYGLFTDAATRFTKNQSPLQNRAVIAKLATDILKIAGGRASGNLIDVLDCDNIDPDSDGWMDKEVEVTSEFINERLGLNLTTEEIKKILQNVEFYVENVKESSKMKILVPFWRTDIEIPEDVVEEVGRLYGYDKLPLELPKRDLTPAQTNPMLQFKSRLREILARAGANEVLTYSFVHGNLLDKVGQDRKLAYQLSNALSPDLQYYRLSLTPSLLEKVHSNIKLGFSQFAIYEINKVHSKTELDEEGLPKEFDRLSLVLAVDNKVAKKNYGGAAFFAAKKQLSYLLRKLGIDVDFVPLGSASLENHQLTQQMVAPYEPAHAAVIISGDKVIGVIGEFKAPVARTLKLPDYCTGFEIFLSALQGSEKSNYKPLNRFPSLEQDITLRSDTKISYVKLSEFINIQLQDASKEHGYNYELEALDIFQREDDKEHKQTTWRIILAHPERTLTTQEANKLLDKIAANTKQELNAERI